MQVTLKMTCENEKQKTDVYEVIHLICNQEKLQLEERGDRVVIEICPQGKIECVEQNDQICLEAHTSHGGPGFHAYCVNLLEWIEEESEASGVLKDDCGFVENPDFQHLKYDVFYPWLNDLKRLLLEGALHNRNYYFDSSYYLPIDQEEVIFTPRGALDREEFANMDVEQLALYFFLWNNEKRDALFYKNCALHLLAKEGYGSYARMNEQSEKYASAIIDYIEIAYQQDPLITLPLRAYHELCMVLGREEQIVDGVEMEEEVSQYRQNEVYHLFHEWSIYAPGCCERSYDLIHDELYLMAPYENENCGWEWMWKIAAHTDEPSLWEHVKNSEKQWKNETAKGVYTMEKEDSFYRIKAIVYGEYPLYIEVILREEKDIPYINACIQQCQYQLHQ